jgi:hydrogenase-4 component B
VNPGLALPLAALAPLVFASLALWRPLRRHLLGCCPLAALPALLAALLLPADAAYTSPQLLLACQWRLDGIARAFLAFTGFGWLLASLFAVRYFKGNPRGGAFAWPFLLCMSGNFLLPAAADAVGFYSGFALMSFAAWPLVAFDRTPQAKRAATIYLILVVIGELLVFPGLVQGALLAGSTDFAAIRQSWGAGADVRPALYLLLLGFGVKAGLAPLHVWLPLAHPAAPTPASAVLSGCMIKAGLLGWLRAFPLGLAPLPHLAHTAGVLGVLTLFGSLLIGLTQSNAKALLAYSSLAKMATLLLLLVPAMADPALAPASVTAACVYALFHSLHKGALFLGVAVTPGLSTRLARILGAGLLIALAASFAGLPFLSGAVAKLPFKKLYPADSPLWLAAGFLTVLLGARFILLTWPGRDAAHPRKPGTFAVWIVAVAAALAFPGLLGPCGLAFDVGKAYQPAYALKGFGPAALALALAAAWGLLRWRLRVHVPAGDLVVCFEKIRLPAPKPEKPKECPVSAATHDSAWIERMEEGLTGGLGGLVFLALTLGLFALLWGSLR